MVDYVDAALFNNDSLDKQIHIVSSDSTVNLGNDDLISESFQLIESLCSEECLMFGAVEPRIVKFSVKYSAPRLLNKWLTITMTLEGSQTPFQFGDYKVLSDKPSSDRTTRDVIAYSHYHGILKNTYKSWYKNAWGNSDTMTIKQFRDSFFERLHSKNSWVVQETTSLPNDNAVIKKSKNIPRISGKDILNAICEINGVFGYIDRDNVFRYKMLNDNNTRYDIGTRYTISSEYEDYTTVAIDRVEILSKDGDVLGEAGATESNSQNKYVIGNNFMLNGLGTSDSSKDTANYLASHLLNAINSVTYIPFDGEFKGNPCFEVGDRISFSSHGTTITSYILQRKMSGIQSLRDNFMADGEERNESGFSSNGGGTTSVFSNKIQAIQDQIGELPLPSNGTVDPIDGQDGDIYVQYEKPHKADVVTKKVYGWVAPAYVETSSSTWYCYDEIDVTCDSGNFVLVAASLSGQAQTGDVTRNKFYTYAVCKVPYGSSKVPQFTWVTSNIQKFNAPPPPPFQHVDPTSLGQNIGYFGNHSDGKARQYTYYWLGLSESGTWFGTLRNELSPADYYFPNIGINDILENDMIEIPDAYEGEYDTQLKFYADGEWNPYVHKVSQAADANISEPENGQTLKYNELTNKWENGEIDTMTGAGSSTDGLKGLVPAPASGDNSKFLCGDGTWQDAGGGNVDDVKVDNVSVVTNKVANINTMTGADGTNAGTKGLVPAPAAEDNEKYLRGDGTWQTIQGGGSAEMLAPTPFIYSEDEVQIGIWIDGKPLYQRTWDFGSNISCASNTWVYVNNTTITDRAVYVNAFGTDADGTVFNCINVNYANSKIGIQNTRSSAINIRYLTVQYTKTTDTAWQGGFKAYGFTPVIYSDTEREIGVWRDGKPLYEKTVYIQNYPSSKGDFTYAHGISNLDVVWVYDGYLTGGNGSTNPLNLCRPEVALDDQFGMNVDRTNIHVKVGYDRSSIYAYVVLRYTKTTDTAGSGKYTTLGTPAVHYSTDEQVIGTWIDGKTLYQKTLITQSSYTLSVSGNWVTTDVSVPSGFETVIKAEIVNNYLAGVIGVFVNSTNGSILISNVPKLGDITVPANTPITVQYTKTS